MRTTLSLFVLSVALFACASRAWAQDPADDAEARSLFEAAKAAFANGRFEDALERFREAYELSERSALLYNIASSLDRLGRLEEAAGHYERYLEARPDAPNRNYVERRLELIAAQIEQGSAEPDAATDDAAEPPEADEAVSAGEGRVEDADREGGAEPASSAPLQSSDPSRIAPITLFSVGGAAAVGAVVTGLMAAGKYGDLEDVCPDGRCPEDARSDRDTLRTLTITTDVLIGVAVASAALGVVLWFFGGDETPQERTPVQAGLGCSGTGCSAGATVRF